MSLALAAFYRVVPACAASWAIAAMLLAGLLLVTFGCARRIAAGIGPHPITRITTPTERSLRSVSVSRTEAASPSGGRRTTH